MCWPCNSWYSSPHTKLHTTTTVIMVLTTKMNRDHYCNRKSYLAIFTFRLLLKNENMIFYSLNATAPWLIFQAHTESGDVTFYPHNQQWNIHSAGVSFWFVPISYTYSSISLFFIHRPLKQTVISHNFRIESRDGVSVREGLVYCLKSLWTYLKCLRL